MQQKKPQADTPFYDLVHLDIFLDEQMDKLNEFEAEFVDFDWETFFQDVVHKSQLDHHNFCSPLMRLVADKLDIYVPEILKVIQKEDDLDDHEMKTGLLKKWLGFLAKDKTNPRRLINTAINFSGLLIDTNTSRYHTMFDLYDIAIDKLSDIKNMPKDNKKDIEDFILEYTVKTMVPFVATQPDCLDRSEIDPDSRSVGETDTIPSCADKIIDTYEVTLDLMAKVMPPNIRRTHIKKMHDAIAAAISEAKTGSWTINDKGRYIETIHPDADVQASCLQLSLGALNKCSSAEQFYEDINIYMPPMLEKTVQAGDPDACYELIKSGIKWLGYENNSEGLKRLTEFTRLQAGYAATLLLEGDNPEYAAHTIADMRNVLQIDKGDDKRDAFLFTDPLADGKPLFLIAHITKEFPKYLDDDLALEFEKGEVVLRDNLEDDEPQFISIIENKEALQEFRKNIDQMYNVFVIEMDNPEITHHTKSLHSIPMKLLLG